MHCDVIHCRAFPDLINSTNTNGETPLYLAVEHSHEVAVKQLLQSGVSLFILVKYFKYLLSKCEKRLNFALEFDEIQEI